MVCPKIILREYFLGEVLLDEKKKANYGIFNTGSDQIVVQTKLVLLSYGLAPEEPLLLQQKYEVCKASLLKKPVKC